MSFSKFHIKQTSIFFFYFLLLFSTFFCLFLPFSTRSYDISNKNQGTVVQSAKVDTSIPKRFKPMTTSNLNDWLDILPPELHKYRSSTQFLVVPAMGMITPIVELEKDNPDYKTAIKGGSFDYMKYLVGGPTIYPGTASVGEIGNTFIFAHSNYWHNKAGDFKTIFRLTYNIEKGDTILYFKKTNGLRTQYTYKVTQSILVNEDAIRVMMPEKGKKELTLSACWPIGTAKQRWINRASLVEERILDYEVDLQVGTPLAKSGNIDMLDNNSSAVFVYDPSKYIAPETKIAADLALITLKLITNK